MDFNVIKLNPSQELALVRARDKALGLEGLKVMQAKDLRGLERLQDLNASVADSKAAQNQKAADHLLVRQEIAPGKPIPLSPLLCVLPDDFTKEEFLAIKKFEVYAAECWQDKKGRDLERRQDLNASGDKKASQAQDLGALYYFPAIIQSGGRKIRAAIPCAFGFALAQNFDLQKIFAAAQTAVQDFSQDHAFSQDQEGGDKKNQGQDLVLTPTSFYFARAEISKNTWSLYDAAWKKLAAT